jgi:cytoskeletal protein CcmA (bactofilin family)
MSVTVPATPPPSAPSARAPPVPAAALTGTLRDVGSVRRDVVRAARWTTSGSVKVLGNVDVGSVRLGGLTSVAGSLRADSVDLKGTLEVNGATEILGPLRGEGALQLRGPFHAGSVELSGSVRSPQDLRVERQLVVTGLVESPSVHAGLLDVTGRLLVPGEVRATAAVQVRFRADSALGTVRAPRVTVRGPPSGLVPNLWRKVFGGSAAVHVEHVEADSVEIESVSVEFVRALSIVLGPHAHVSALEGTVVRQHPTAHVGPESRSPPPHGLSR